MPVAKQEQNKATNQMAQQLGTLGQPMNDMLDYFREYAREKPEAAMLWCFSIGFLLGWKLKPW